MAGALPVEARRSIIRAARTALEAMALPSAPAIPVTAAGWASALRDAGLDRPQVLLADELAALERADIAEDLRTAADALASAGLALAADVWCLGALRTEGDEPGRLREAIKRLALAGLDAAVLENGPGRLADARRAADTAAAELRDATDGTCQDPCHEIFDIPLDEARDDRGAFAIHRALSAWHGRYDALAARLAIVLRPITDDPPDVVNAVWPTAGLVLTNRPLLTLRAAVMVRSAIDSALAHGPDRASAFRALKLRVERGRASHLGILRAGAAIAAARSDDERALAELDLYRRMVEGQLRPWAWTLLRARGRSGSEPQKLSALRDQLMADGDPVMLDAAAAILPAVRNAAAHEDAWWDGAAGVLRVGDNATTTRVELHDATERAYALMSGAESALACARAASPRLAAFLDAEDPHGGLPAINEMTALNHFGTNGLRVRNVQREGSTLAIALDELAVEQVNRCIQAVMIASRYLTFTERFRVSAPGLDHDALDLNRAALDATFVVWQQARLGFDTMPTSTFLPAGAWARLAVELPDESARATAWLAVNDALHAYDEAHEPTSTTAREARATRLAARLGLIASAMAATMTVLPSVSTEPLREILQLTDDAAHWAASLAMGRTPGPSSAIEERIRFLHESLPIPAAFPTVDPRPLG